MKTEKNINKNIGKNHLKYLVKNYNSILKILK